MIRSAPCARAKSRHALNACRLAWISAKKASSTFSSASTLSAEPAPELIGYQTTRRRRHAIRLKGEIEVKQEGSSAFAIRGAPQYRAGETIWRDGLALARRRF